MPDEPTIQIKLSTARVLARLGPKAQAMIHPAYTLILVPVAKVPLGETIESAEPLNAALAELRAAVEELTRKPDA